MGRGSSMFNDIHLPFALLDPPRDTKYRTVDVERACVIWPRLNAVFVIAMQRALSGRSSNGIMISNVLPSLAIADCPNVRLRDTEGCSNGNLLIACCEPLADR